MVSNGLIYSGIGIRMGRKDTVTMRKATMCRCEIRRPKPKIGRKPKTRSPNYPPPSRGASPPDRAVLGFRASDFLRISVFGISDLACPPSASAHPRPLPLAILFALARNGRRLARSDMPATKEPDSLDAKFYKPADAFFPAYSNIGLTFDDVTLATRYSEVLPRDTQLDTTLAEGLQLNIPVISADMDTVTESRMAIAMALNGGAAVVLSAATVYDAGRGVAAQHPGDLSGHGHRDRVADGHRHGAQRRAGLYPLPQGRARITLGGQTGGGQRPNS